MEEVLQDFLVAESILIYLDDVVILGYVFLEEHFLTFIGVLKRLLEANMRVNVV